MKRYFAFALLAMATVGAMTSCSDDDISSESVIVVQQTEATEFDKWLDANFVAPYNIQFVYRYEDNETDMAYYNVPADYNQAVKLAHIVKHTCLDVYSAVAGATFTKSYFPKMLYCSGVWEYRNNGTFILGTAEGGKKIFLAGVNFLNQYLTSVDMLNDYYLKTIHHEFTHILNQTSDYPASFRAITSSGYVADNWSESPYDADNYWLQHGFITAYAQNSHKEDFAEMLSEYVTKSQAQWDAQLALAGDDGAALIRQKLDIVRSYMNDKWGVDIDQLRDAVLQSEQEVVDGKVDLTSLSVN